MFVLRARHAQIDQLLLGRIELRFRLRHVGAGSDPRVMPGLCELQKIGVRIDGGLQQRDIAIGAVQLKIILRQIRLVGEFRIFELRFGGLRGLGVRPRLRRILPHRST